MVLQINSLPFYTLILTGSHGSAAMALKALSAATGVCVCVCVCVCVRAAQAHEHSVILSVCPCVPLCGHGRVNNIENSWQILLRTPRQGARIPLKCKEDFILAEAKNLEFLAPEMTIGSS